MKHLASLVFVLAACKGKKNEPAAPPPTPGSASAVVVETDAAAAAPPAKVVTIAAGVANFGCLGWSRSAKAAACITGESALGEPAKYLLTFLGTEEPQAKITIKSEGSGEDFYDDLTAANAALSKLAVEPFAVDAKDIEPGKTTDLGGGASLTWTAKETVKGGENQPPTMKHLIVVTCANKKTAEVLAIEQDGTNPEIRAWSTPDHVVLDLETHIGREGESRRISTPMMLELATCELDMTP
jgi:hypothetical protein